MIKNVLVYVEPHPLRNSFTEFHSVAKFMAKTMALMPSVIEWRIYSNRYILKEFENNEVHFDNILHPTDRENNFIDESFGEWTEDEIDKRRELVAGKGAVSDFYRNTLGRVRSIFNFDVVILWSENGAVRSFAQQHNIPVFHLELGPTRAPFPETVYIDCSGTNGNASAVTYDLETYPKKDVVSRETWLSSALMGENSVVSPTEHILAWKKPHFTTSDQPYVIVALQLRDDLNTIDHSPFRTPKEFLEKIIPPLLGHGYRVFVKGHPGSATRPINLISEIDALHYARGLGSNVEVLDRNMIPTEFIRLLSRATAVCSINSSVCFEALLLGVPGFVFGSAAYDVGERLKTAGAKFLMTGEASLDTLSPDELTSFLMRHYLHPYRPENVAKVLSVLLACYKINMTRGDFLSILLSQVSHGTEILDDEINRAGRYRRLEDALPSIKQVDNSLVGHIDKVALERKGDSHEIIVRGWIARSERKKAPVEFVALFGEELGNPIDLFDRSDVKRIHPSLALRSGFHVAVKVDSATNLTDFVNAFRLLFVAGSEAFWCEIAKGGIRKITDQAGAVSKKSNMSVAVVLQRAVTEVRPKASEKKAFTRMFKHVAKFMR
ncbi:GT99 family glycosyltransferase N-terminal domain-containing protein [Rhizobium rhizogenes]|uniref:capsular polysaccharide export protein, LipB/KpsS family n=1 Tax=Rhizobium rhizogenes TaxID=359 RepID=UPI0015729F16|nr:polysialyltransferase family glycosyltransferase [Rhizobium rhizogenes]NTF90932.1 hypothetical protein [Rhizobium rhizogenes]